MHKKTTKDWDDLLLLVQEAHKLADMMFSGPNEYRLEFVGIGKPFQQSTMNSRDPFVQGASNSDLEKAGAIVRLGISPFVTFRSNNAEGTIGGGNVMQADVLVRKRD